MTNSLAGRGETRSRLLMKVSLLCFSLFVAVGFGEIALRLLWHNPFVAELPDHLLKLAIQHPNTDHWVDRSAFDPEDPRVRFRSDARAYVLPAGEHADPDATIAFLGGSTTACNAVTEDVRFPALVAQLLTARGTDTNSKNAARSGGTLHDSLNVLLNHVLFDRPDIVVVMEATNDIGVLGSPRGYESRAGAPVRTSDLAKWLLQMGSSHSSLLGLVRSSQLAIQPERKFGHVVEKNDPSQPLIDPKPFEQRLRSFVRVAKSFDVVPVLMTQPLASSRSALTPEWADLGNQDRFNAVIREVARSEDAVLIDLVQYLQERVPGWDAPMKFFYDGMHVNDEGSRVYAAHIADRLEPLVREIAARRSAEKQQLVTDAIPRGSAAAR